MPAHRRSLRPCPACFSRARIITRLPGRGTRGVCRRRSRTRATCCSPCWPTCCSSSGAWSAACSRRSSARCRTRSEEHTSELQSPDHLVCRLLLEKKKKNKKITTPLKKQKIQKK